jgi:predicted permease
MGLAVPRSKYPADADVAAFYTRILEAVTSIPGVRHAGLVNRLPLGGSQVMSSAVQTARGDTVQLNAIDSRPVTPDYFNAIGIPLQGGRSFTEHDDANAPPVSIVDNQLAQRMWPGESPLGKRVRFPDTLWSTVVGVVSHVHDDAIDVDPRPQIYWSYHQITQDRMVLVVRGNGDPHALIHPIRQAVRDVDADQPVYDVRTMDDVVDSSLAQRRLVMVLIVSFGAIALVLAAVGVYGVVAYGVTQRLREFGIRVALGASRWDVTRLVVRQGLATAVAGAVVGLVGAVALGGLMRTLVFGIAPRDLVSLSLATGTLLVVAALASYLPARRAARVDPAVALRSE